MTIKDLPILDSIKSHFLSNSPLDNQLILEVQDSQYAIEVKTNRPEMWKIRENKLALLMKQNQSVFIESRIDAENEYGLDCIQNAKRYLQCIINKKNMPNFWLHVSVISWFIYQFVDIEKTLKANRWQES